MSPKPCSNCSDPYVIARMQIRGLGFEGPNLGCKVEGIEFLGFTARLVSGMKGLGRKGYI